MLARFTKQELEEGFWEIMGYTHNWSLGDLIEYSDAPLSSRKESIEPMAVLFERLFSKGGYLCSHVVGLALLFVALRE